MAAGAVPSLPCAPGVLLLPGGSPPGLRRFLLTRVLVTAGAEAEAGLQPFPWQRLLPGADMRVPRAGRDRDGDGVGAPFPAPRPGCPWASAHIPIPAEGLLKRATGVLRRGR